MIISSYTCILCNMLITYYSEYFILPPANNYVYLQFFIISGAKSTEMEFSPK